MNILVLRAATSGSPNAFPFLPPGPDKHKRPIGINFLVLVVTIRKYLKTENDQEKVGIPGIYYPQDKLMFFHINQTIYNNGRKRHFYNGENQVEVVKIIPPDGTTSTGRDDHA